MTTLLFNVDDVMAVAGSLTALLANQTRQE